MKPAAQVLIAAPESRAVGFARQAGIVIGASLFVALCARITLPLPFTPVPLTLQNFAVLLVGLTLGSRRGFAALALYLAEGAAGAPVFNSGMGGVAHLAGATGGYLMAYPLVALVAGWIAERGEKSFARFAIAAAAAEMLLFTSGISWLMLVLHSSLVKAASFGLYPFVPAEIMKVMTAAAVGLRFRK